MEAYGGEAEMVCIYIAEAHASDGWTFGDANGRGGRWTVATHKSLEDRIKTCNGWLESLGAVCKSQYYVDAMCDGTRLAYDSHPERLYVVEDGIVQYQGKAGPHGYDLNELEQWLAGRFPGVQTPAVYVKPSMLSMVDSMND